MSCGEKNMPPAEVRKLLESRLQNCEIEVEGDGSYFDITVVGDVFEGLRPIKRQQLVYGALNDCIADGSIHAVNMTTQTRSEAGNRQN